MSSGTKSIASSIPTSPCPASLRDLASESADSGGLQSQLELPKHDEHSIYCDDKVFKRGKACPAKQRDRCPNTWYWKHGEEIYDDKQRRWMCEPCWEDKKFTHYSQTSNRTIVKHLKEDHEIIEDGIQLTITLVDDSSASILVT